MAKVSNTKKGKLGQTIIRRMMEERGFLVHDVKPTKFQSQDVFGLFDIVALDATGETVYGQVKYHPSTRHPTSAINQFTKDCRRVLKHLESLPLIYFFWVLSEDGSEVYILEDDFHFEPTDNWVLKADLVSQKEMG